MNNNAEENSEITISKKIKDNTLLEAIESDHRLNKSRLKNIGLKLNLIPKILKDYFGVILFTIYGLGAFIQVLEIFFIDLSYLRFFSVKQIASDGALVSVTLTITILMGYAYYFLVTLRFRENSSIKNISITTPLLILFVVVMVGYGVLANLIIEIDIYKKFPSAGALIISPVMVALLAYFIKYSEYTNNEINLLENTDKNKEFFVKGLLQYINFLSYIFIPIIILKSLMIYSEILREPIYFENYNKVGSVIQERHKDVIEYKVLYFNNEYTFIELTRAASNKNTIEVYKTDAILFDETVIKIK